MVRLSLLWGLGLVLIPLIALQGWWVRRKALRLGPADGPMTGRVTVLEAPNDASSALTGGRQRAQGRASRLAPGCWD